MARRKSPDKASTDREKKWDKVFNASVKLCQNLQEDRKFLERQVKSLHQVVNWMKMEKNFESAKAELAMGLKERDAFIYKHRYDKADDELSDLREWFDYVSQKCSQSHSASVDARNKGRGSQIKLFQDEITKLKSKLEKYESEKNSEVSALLAEKNFVWNQFSKMESDFTEKLKKKCLEVEHSNEKVQLLVSRAEQLELSNENLRTNLAKAESESAQKTDEICRLLKEIELLKSRLDLATPLLQPCGAKAASRSKGDMNSRGDRRIITVKKESGPLHTIEKKARTRQSTRRSAGVKAATKQSATKQSIIKGHSNSKRKPFEVITIPDTPKLFSSSFKVPKLKHSSSPARAALSAPADREPGDPCAGSQVVLPSIL